MFGKLFLDFEVKSFFFVQQMSFPMLNLDFPIKICWSAHGWLIGLSLTFQALPDPRSGLPTRLSLWRFRCNLDSRSQMDWLDGWPWKDWGFSCRSGRRLAGAEEWWLQLSQADFCKPSAHSPPCAVAVCHTNRDQLWCFILFSYYLNTSLDVHWGGYLGNFWVFTACWLAGALAVGYVSGGEGRSQAG